MKHRKTGCMTCRIRKVRCDETKPNCHRCSSTGRICDGYSTLPFSRNELLAASRSSGKLPAKDPSSKKRLSILPCFFSNDAFRGMVEKRYFQFFRDCTVASTNLTVDSRFWDSLVPQACDAVPAIKYVVLALASLHNSVITRDDQDVAQKHLLYSEKQYQRALSETNQLINTPSTKQIDRVLVVCALFIVFEGMRGNYAASRAHMDSGRAIAARHPQAVAKTSNSSSTREIAEVFARLDIFALSFSDAAAPYQYTLDDLLLTGPELRPWPFSSIREAQASLMDLMRWMLVTGDQMLLKADPIDPMLVHFEAQLRSCRRRLLKWKCYWNEMLRTAEQRTSEQRDQLPKKMVELWYYKALALVESGFIGPETRYDSTLPHFQQIALLCSEVSSLVRERAEIAGFSLDLGYLAPAFFCAIRCRNPDVRRRAIHALECHPRREGMWESTVATAIAKRWMLLEEEALGEVVSAHQIPESNRFATVDLEVNPTQSTVSLRFTPSVTCNKWGCRVEELHW